VLGWGRAEESLVMSPANKNALVASAASIFMLIAVFAKPLHIPDPWDFLPMFAAAVCFYLVFRANKKIKNEQIGKPVPVVPLAAKKKYFWLIAFSLIAGSIGIIPLLPYTVENFSPSLYFYVVPAQVVAISIFLFYLWKKLVGSANSPK
jgi:hypothetical protein